MFQSTRSHGARLKIETDCEGIVFVSIHALAWSATVLTLLRLLLRICFNPRARMERDIRSFQYLSAGMVSIHALAWSATLGLIQILILIKVSIHALAWSATFNQIR